MLQEVHYLKVYEEIIHVVPGAKDYIKTSYEPLHPPKIKKILGRPKKMRRKGPDEVQQVSTRKCLTHACRNCFEVGHNKGSCKNPPHPKSKLYKGPTIHEEIVTDAPPLSQDASGCSQPQSQAPREPFGYQGRTNEALLGWRGEELKNQPF
ncbi:UNVERIFIED_CONTAM: hypothetical protein Slati_3762500 [Sesamum latifolium]|uniref:Uncharacterized protein n=1 Tax=Sesamum latifolium TaxID=2727402 RepID=A0AAW2U4J1_9LAMI